jgi:hypothetical protein
MKFEIMVIDGGQNVAGVNLENEFQPPSWPFIAVFVDTNVIIIFKILVGWFMVFNATFNNISVISRRSVLLVEETVVPGENHRPVASQNN